MSSFRKLAVISTLATFVLVTVGGLVRATGSGMGCSTSWPDCSGRLIPDFRNHHVAIEFTHRAIAGVVMILIGLLAIQAWKNRHRIPQLVAPTVGAFLLVLFQAGLGAVVVKLHLENESVVLHLGAAMSLLALLVYILGLTAVTEGADPGATDTATSKRAMAAAASVFLLLLAGSYVSGYPGAGRAFSDWPLMGGELIPNLAVEENAIHFFHRALAAVVGAILVVTLIPVLRNKSTNRTAARAAHVALGLFAVEVLIGALNVWTELNAAAVTAHLIVGASIWASLVGTAVATSPRLRERARGGLRSTQRQPVEQGA